MSRVLIATINAAAVLGSIHAHTVARQKQTVVNNVALAMIYVAILQLVWAIYIQLSANDV